MPSLVKMHGYGGNGDVADICFIGADSVLAEDGTCGNNGKAHKRDCPMSHRK